MDCKDMTVGVALWNSLEEMAPSKDLECPLYLCTAQLEGREDFNVEEAALELRDFLIKWATGWVRFGAKVTIQESREF